MTQINVSIAKNFEDIEAQQRNLRSTILHECFHIQQRFTFSEAPFTALEAALYEGCAVVFEEEQTGGVVAYADYHGHTEAELERWLGELRTVGYKYFEDTETWHAWAFYHPEYKERWIVYKVGTWLLHRILKENNLKVADVKNMSADAIMNLDKKVDIYKAGGVIIKDRRFLVTRSAGKDFFIAPGGKLEPGETAIEALAREMNEEVQMTIDTDTLESLGSFFAIAAGKDDTKLQMDVFIIHDFEGEIVPSSEVEEVRWINSQTNDISLGSIFQHDVMPLLKQRDLID